MFYMIMGNVVMIILLKLKLRLNKSFLHPNNIGVRGGVILSPVTPKLVRGARVLSLKRKGQKRDITQASNKVFFIHSDPAFTRKKKLFLRLP